MLGSCLAGAHVAVRHLVSLPGCGALTLNCGASCTTFSRLINPCACTFVNACTPAAPHRTTPHRTQLHTLMHMQVCHSCSRPRVVCPQACGPRVLHLLPPVCGRLHRRLLPAQPGTAPVCLLLRPCVSQAGPHLRAAGAGVLCCNEHAPDLCEFSRTLFSRACVRINLINCSLQPLDSSDSAA